MSGAEVKHCGEVVRVQGARVVVRMTVNSACGSCQARSVCGAGESADRIVEVETDRADEFNVGDEVEVALRSNSMGTRSVALAYVAPFFVLAASLAGLTAAGVGEGVAAAGALGGAAVYYVLLYALRDRIGKSIKFTITKITK